MKQIIMIQKRKTDLDIMRVIAIIGVIVIHSLGKWSDIEIISVIWRYSTYAVPLLVMISGAVWLGMEREVSIKKIWTKYIFHIVTAFAFWSVVYACIHYKDFGSAKEFIWRCIIGNYHSWYCYMIVGIYIFLPLLKYLKKNVELYHYLIILVLFSSIILPAISAVPMAASVTHILDLLELSIGNEYLFYFLMGNILYEKESFHRMTPIVYGWGILSIVLIFTGYFNGSDASFARMGYTMFIFLIIKNLCNKYEGVTQKIALSCGKTAQMCFGIYLVHDVFLYIYNESMVVQNLSPYLAAFVKVVFCFSASYLVVCFIKKVPILGKYIV